MLVVICRPAAAFWAAFARTVSPLQVTVTGPAGMLAVEVNVSLRASLADLSNVEATEDGTETPHAVAAALLVIRLAGTARERKSLVPLKVAVVVKEMVAVPAVVGLVGNADSVGATSAAVV